MIDMNKYKHRSNTLIGRLRKFVVTEVGNQPFTVRQLVRAAVDNDPVLAKRDIGSVRDGVNNIVRAMCASGELEVLRADKLGNVYVLKQGGGE